MSTFGFTPGNTGTNFFGATPATTTSAAAGFGGISFGSTPGTSAAAPAAGGFSFGTPAVSSAAPVTGGFSFGNVQATTAASTGFPLTGALDSSQGAQKAVRFDTGSTATTQAPTFGAFPATTASTSTLSGLLSGNKPTLNLGVATTTTVATSSSISSSGFGFGGTALGTGLSLPTTTTSNFFGTTTTSLGAATSTGLGLGGLGTTNVFGATTTTCASQGLGGVDPKTAGSSSATSGSSKTCDGKALKENPVDAVILNSVEEFTKHVKSQKNIRENISRMSSKPLCKVKEEMKNLQQKLILVSNGLQKNSVAIDKLKKEANQELKYAEMAHRTKDTPPGLQYENTAPTEYFHRLTEEFETQMVLYRQQILDTENHLISLNQSSMLTPQELSQLFMKLNDGFTALASQLQVVHEAVKDQKEQYLEYRKLYHGDTKDIFARRKKVQESMMKSMPPSTIGPTPFSALPGIGTVANSCQAGLSQPKPAAAAGIGFGATGTTQAGFGQTAPSGGSVFGNTATTGTGGTFGTTSTPGSGLFGGGFGNTGFTPALNFPPAATCTPSQTQKPFGSKRGKNA